MSRTLAREGRGKVWVNGKLATVALLAELVGEALEITSQGEHQRLLRPEAQAELLDAYAGLGDGARGGGCAPPRLARARERDRDAPSRPRSAGAARGSAALRDRADRARRAARRRARRARAELRRLGHVDRLAQASATALELLDGEGGLRERLGAARGALRGLSELDAELAEPEAALERARLELDEATLLLSRYAAQLEADPERLAQVEQRLGELRRLQTRYGATLEDVIAHSAKARAELDGLEGGEERTAELERELADVSERLDQRSRALSDARRDAAKTLERVVGVELKALELGRAELHVEFEPLIAKGADGLEPPSGPSGRERASFWLAANPGEAPGRLRDAASGGELSRLLLALRNVLRDADAGRLLLFDEIDAGPGRPHGRPGRRAAAQPREPASSDLHHASAAARRTW